MTDKLKKDLEEALKIIDSVPFPPSTAIKMYAEEDENDVVHLKNEGGHTYMMMSRKDYDDILAWKIGEINDKP